MSDGYTYKGQWLKDMKHGQGYMRTEEGDEIYGTWQYDKANGMARVLKDGDHEFTNVIFVNDMMIEEPGSLGLDCADIAYLIFAIIFLLIFAGGILVGIFFLL